MRKSTVFISAVLTTFALVMLYKIAAAYNDSKNIEQVAAEPTATLAPTTTELPVPTNLVLGPTEAAQLAAQVVGNTNLLSAESSTINGVDAYMITFTNNDVVYVGLDGQILSVQVAPVMVNVAPPVEQKNNRGGNQIASNGSGGEDHHESSEGQHEEGHDD